MTTTKEQRETFDQACKPLMDWLLANTHPHCTVIVDSRHAELVEGLASVIRKDGDRSNNQTQQANVAYLSADVIKAGQDATVAAKDAEIRGTCHRCGRPITTQHAMVTHGDSGHSFHQACDLMRLNEAKQGMIDNLLTKLTAKDAEIARLRATAVQECKAWKDALLASEMENLREENRRLTAERDAAVKRAEDAEFSQAAMQEVVTTLIKAFAGIDVLIRNGDEDGIVQRFADAEKAMDAVVGKPSEAASAIRSRLAAAEKVVEAARIEANQSIAYASHWRTRQALAALDAAKKGHNNV